MMMKNQDHQSLKSKNVPQQDKLTWWQQEKAWEIIKHKAKGVFDVGYNERRCGTYKETS